MAQGKKLETPLARPLAITAAIIGLIQGLVWFVFAILCILCYFDVITLELNINDSAEYYSIIYNLFLKSSFTPANDVIITPQAFFIVMWFYIVLSAIWTLLSGILLWAMLHDQWQFTKRLFASWSLTTASISILDLIFTSLIGSDYSYYTGLAGISNDKLTSYGIVMSLAARGFLLWLINVIFAAIMGKYAMDTAKNENPTTALPIIHGYETSNVATPWYNGPVQNDWMGPQETSFQRSTSFFPVVPPHPPEDHNPSRMENFYQNKFPQKTPYIPDPDYTPPNTPTGLKSVLKARSHY